MIIEKAHLNKHIEENVKIQRYDMAINFYSVLNINSSPNLVCYDYNPVW